VLYPRALASDGRRGGADPHGERGRAYRQLGNAVCPPIVADVGRALMASLSSANANKKQKVAE